jgi:hypothetical protein
VRWFRFCFEIIHSTSGFWDNPQWIFQKHWKSPYWVASKRDHTIFYENQSIRGLFDFESSFQNFSTSGLSQTEFQIYLPHIQIIKKKSVVCYFVIWYWLFLAPINFGSIGSQVIHKSFGNFVKRNKIFNSGGQKAKIKPQRPKTEFGLQN